jgi:hypothetical protein
MIRNGGAVVAIALGVLSGCSGRAEAEHIGGGAEPLASANVLPNDLAVPNPSGVAATHSTSGSIDLDSPFFQVLGTNGRRCATCHVHDQGWTVTPEKIQERFAATQGTDPIFRTNDGSVSPDADVSTVDARRTAYAMLLQKGLIRVGIGVPASADFELVAVDDPYGHASAAELSLFRRVLPATNLRFLTTVMWDGRETFPGQSIAFDLGDQANGATMGHAQGGPLTPSQRDAIVAFESALTTAQVWDAAAGDLRLFGALGGPVNLASQPFYVGINDLGGDSRTGAPFDPTVFRIFTSWSGQAAAPRASIARGEALFDGRTFAITGVGGLDDRQGTCTTCHDTPNVGDHSVVAPLDLGLVDAPRRTPDLPLYTLREKGTGRTRQVTDPGRALISGRFRDVGRFKGPVLRALPTRAPYFHNGSAATLADVLDFYDGRFSIGLSAQEKADLEAFLRAL